MCFETYFRIHLSWQLLANWCCEPDEIIGLMQGFGNDIQSTINIKLRRYKTLTLHLKSKFVSGIVNGIEPKLACTFYVQPKVILMD